MHIRLLITPALICIAMVAMHGYAQKLPPASRTVFKCQEAGKTVYSDAPCLGAKRIDVEPTRGLNKSSGRVQIGADVQHEQYREMVAEAIRPLTGLDAKQLAVRGRRNKLSLEDQMECRVLDGDMSAAQQDEKNATQSDLKDVQLKLYQLRKRFHKLGCNP
jgi:hypothetical protein